MARQKQNRKGPPLEGGKKGGGGEGKKKGKGKGGKGLPVCEVRLIGGIGGKAFDLPLAAAKPAKRVPPELVGTEAAIRLAVAAVGEKAAAWRLRRDAKRATAWAEPAAKLEAEPKPKKEAALPLAVRCRCDRLEAERGAASFLAEAERLMAADETEAKELVGRYVARVKESSPALAKLALRARVKAKGAEAVVLEASADDCAILTALAEAGDTPEGEALRGAIGE